MRKMFICPDFHGNIIYLLGFSIIVYLKLCDGNAKVETTDAIKEFSLILNEVRENISTTRDVSKWTTR